MVLQTATVHSKEVLSTGLACKYFCLNVSPFIQGSSSAPTDWQWIPGFKPLWSLSRLLMVFQWSRLFVVERASSPACFDIICQIRLRQWHQIKERTMTVAKNWSRANFWRNYLHSVVANLLIGQSEWAERNNPATKEYTDLICICKWVDTPTLPHKPAVVAATSDLVWNSLWRTVIKWLESPEAKSKWPSLGCVPRSQVEMVVKLSVTISHIHTWKLGCATAITHRDEPRSISTGVIGG